MNYKYEAMAEDPEVCLCFAHCFLSLGPEVAAFSCGVCLSCRIIPVECSTAIVRLPMEMA